MLSTNCCFIFVKDLIVFRHGDTENDCRYVFETMDPFLPLGPLTTDVEQSER